MQPQVVVVLGTRPELVKMADAVRALRNAASLDVVVVFTGQHAELMTEVAASLGVAPDISIRALPRGRSLTDLLAHVIGELGRVPELERAACLLVQGDTASSLAAALVSEMMAIPLIHVEAGVRSRLRDDPFPEETIRRMISPISELHLCFSQVTRDNLLEEGIHEDLIAVVPHPMRDRVLSVSTEEPPPTPEVLVTLHRRERRVQRADRLVELMHRLREAQPNALLSFIWHPSLDGDVPGLARRLEDAGVSVSRSLAPDAFLQKLATAALVITDSAGVAEEVQLLGKPLIAFRASAEARLDEVPKAPMCVTESVVVAAEFVDILGDLPAAPEGVASASVVSAGSVIASIVEAFVSGGAAAAKTAWASVPTHRAEGLST